MQHGKCTDKSFEVRGRHSRPLQKSIAGVLDRAASRIYAILGVCEVIEEELSYEMVRSAYGFDREEANKYLNEMEVKMKGQ